MSENKGFWNKTKEVTEDIWEGTKNVTEDVWDGTKEVAGSVKNAFVGDKDEKSEEKTAHRRKENHSRR